MNRLRLKRWKLGLMTFCAFAVVVLLIGAYQICVRPISIARVAYCQDWAARMLISHMERTDMGWPSSWADLEEDHDLVSIELGGISSLEEIAKIVHIDFKFHPDEFLLNGCTPLPQIITPISGVSYHWSGDEPNRMVTDWICLRLNAPSKL